MPFASIRPLATAAACLLLGACTIAQPSIRPVAARTLDSAEGATRLELELELRNPGDAELDLIEYDYTIDLEDGARYSGRWAALQTLPARATIRALVPAVVPTESASGSWRMSGTMSYRDPDAVSRLLFDLGLLENRAAFSGTGKTIEPAP